MTISAVSYWEDLRLVDFCLSLRCRRFYEVITAIEDWRSTILNDVHKFWRYLSVAATVAILLGAGVFVFEVVAATR
jgi:hypothetical protein